MKEEEIEEEVVVPVKKREVASKVVASADDDEGFSSVGKGGKAIIAVTQEGLLTRLREVLESRGKKVIIILVFFTNGWNIHPKIEH